MRTFANILILIGCVLCAWQYIAVYGKEVVMGKVTAVELYRGSRNGATYRVAASFSDRSGATHMYRADFGTIDTGYQAGDPIRLYFDRDHPEDCGVLSFGYRFGLGWGFIVAGCAIWFFLSGVTAGNQWIANFFPPTVP